MKNIGRVEALGYLIERYGTYPNLFYVFVRTIVKKVFGKKREKKLRNKLRLGRLGTFLELFYLPELLIDYYVAEKLKLQMKNKSHERSVTNFLLSCYGDCFVDCGANLGYYTFMLSGHFHKVIAIEPLPRNVRVMKMVGNEENIKIMQVAVSDKNGYTNLYFGPHRGGGTFYKNERGFIKVKTITLDEILEDVEDVIVKVDVEGHEYAVIKGAQKSMYKIRIWVIEIHGSYRGLDLEDNEVSNFLRTYGYDVRPINDNHIVAERV